MSAEDVPQRYRTETDLDGDFNRAVADDAVVADAWTAWEEEIAFADRFLAGGPDLERVADDARNGPVLLREVLVHIRGVLATQRPRRPVARAHRRLGRLPGERGGRSDRGGILFALVCCVFVG